MTTHPDHQEDVNVSGDVRTEPRTEAGRALLDGFAPMPEPDRQELHRRSQMGRRVKVAAGIVAIEAEARAAALAEVEDAVKGLRDSAGPPARDPKGKAYDHDVQAFDSVLSAIASLSPKEAETP